MTDTAAPVTLPDIEQAAADLRRALDAAAEEVSLYDADIAQAVASVRDHVVREDSDGAPVTRLDVLRDHALAVRACRAHVLELIDQARPLFRRPKSRTVHGITVGLRQAGGKLRWPSAAALVRLVRERLAPSRAAALIQTAEIVQVSTLTPEDRIRLGIEREPAIDQPICTEDGADTAARLVALLAAADPAEEAA
jgi:hypothetical protein